MNKNLHVIYNLPSTSDCNSMSLVGIVQIDMQLSIKNERTRQKNLSTGYDFSLYIF